MGAPHPYTPASPDTRSASPRDTDLMWGAGDPAANRPLPKGSGPMVYPTGGCVPQSGLFAPGACVTWVKPVPSTLTV